MRASDSTTRLSIVGATTVVMMLLVWLAAPALTTWQRGRLAKQLAEQIASHNDSAVKVPLRQLANLGDPAIEPLVVAAASERDAVSVIARQIIDEKLTAWELLAEESASPHHDADFIVSMLKLAATLAVHIEKFGPTGKQWAERAALAMIARAHTFPARRSGSLLENCSNILASVPPHGPRLRTVTALGEVSAPDAFPEQATPQPRLEPLTRASEGSLEILARLQPRARALSLPASDSHPGTTLKFQERLTEVHPSEVEASVQPTESASRKLNWTRQPSSTLEQSTTPLPVTTMLEGIPGGVATRPDGDNRRAIDVPTPQDMQKQTAALQRLSVNELIARLPSASYFEAGIVRSALRERGFEDTELVLIRRLFSPDVAVRQRLVEDISILPAASALRFLQLLLNDTNADVRLQALTALATTNAPNLAELARELAVRDEDPRVSELASRLLRPTR